MHFPPSLERPWQVWPPGIYSLALYQPHNYRTTRFKTRLCNTAHLIRIGPLCDALDTRPSSTRRGLRAGGQRSAVCRGVDVDVDVALVPPGFSSASCLCYFF